MSPLYPSVDAIDEALYDKVMDVNLKGPFRLSALVGTRMAGPDHGGSNGGSIIFVSSTASHRPRRTNSSTAPPRPGVNNLTKGLARTFGPKREGELHRPRPVPDRHLQGVGSRHVREVGQGRIRPRARRSSRTRSSAPRSTSPRMRRRTPPAPSSTSTAAPAEQPRLRRSSDGAVPSEVRRKRFSGMTGGTADRVRWRDGDALRNRLGVDRGCDPGGAGDHPR